MRNVDKLVDALIIRMHSGRGNLVTGAEGCAYIALLALIIVSGTVLGFVALILHGMGKI